MTQIEEDLESIDDEISELGGMVVGEQGEARNVQKFKKLLPKKPMTVMKFEY